MKFFNVKGTLRAFVFALSLLVVTIPTFAQNNSNANANARGGERADRSETPRTVVREDNDTDWGWLGLLGLLGLAGLIPKKRKVEVQEFRDTNRPTGNAGTPQ
jgi:MYXO-CTERM domain-containing protein